MIRSLLLILALTFSGTFASTATAQTDIADLFVPVENDYSLYIIGKIFGNIDQNVLPGNGSATGSELLGDAFRVFNIIILAVSVTIVIYTITVGILQTAHHGKPFGEKMSSMWVPIRIAVAIAMLIPKTNGYCYAQVIVAWLVVQGVGVADSVWNIALDYFEAGGSLNQDSPGELNASLVNGVYQDPFLKFLMRAGTCVYTHNLDEVRRGHYDIYSYVEGTTYYLNFGLKPEAGVPISGNSNYYECGRMEMYIWTNDLGSQEKADDANEKQLQIVRDLATALGSDIGYQIAHDLLPTEPGSNRSNWTNDFKLVQNDATNYVTAMDSVAPQFFIPDSADLVEHIDVMREGGWILAGNYYQVLASLETKSIFTVSHANTPGFTDDVSFGAATEYAEQIALSDKFYEDFYKWAKENNYSSETPTQALSEEVEDALNDANSIFSDIGMTNAAVSHMTGFMNMLTGAEGSTDPILRATHYGRDLMLTSSRTMVGLTVILPVAAVVAGWCTASSPGGVIMNATLASVLPMAYGILGFMYTQGAFLAVYLPMVPFIVFMIGGIGWIFAVIEAMVAAPLVALGMTLPEGHEIYGKAEPAYMLLINLFFRPSLMIIGFLAAMMVAWLATELLNVTFENALLFGGVTPDPIIGQYVVSLTYVGILVAIMTKVFGLINLVPDRVLRWIGDNSQAFIGAEEALQGGRQSTQEAAGQAGQAGGQMVGFGGRIGGRLTTTSGDENWKGLLPTGKPAGGQTQGGSQTTSSGTQPGVAPGAPAGAPFANMPGSTTPPPVTGGGTGGTGTNT